MKSNIELYVENEPFEIDYWYFSAGEIACRIGELGVTAIQNRYFPRIRVYAQIRDPTGLIAARQLVDSVKAIDRGAEVSLILPYFPHSRQDKVFNPGESESRMLVCNMFSDCLITTADMHREMHSIKEVTQEEILMELFRQVSIRQPMDNIAILSTDKGEVEKVEAFIDQCPWNFDIAKGYKVRDPMTRKLTGFSIEGDCKGKHVWTIDDIIDSGNTNCGIADLVLAQNPASLTAFATHGIFSKGFAELNKRFDKIITTDTILDTSKWEDPESNLAKPKNLHVLNIKQWLLDAATPTQRETN